MSPDPIHATCVAWGSAAVLIKGASGSGKSALGLMLMGMGCQLVADDRVLIRREGDQIIASAPPPTKGLIEARGIGLLESQTLDQARVVLVVDLDQTEHDRLPQRRKVTILQCDIALIYAYEGPHFAAAVLQILKAGWSDR